MRGYFGIGCLNMKHSVNYGTLFRSAKIMNADFVFVIGRRFKKQNSDTIKSFRYIPTYHYETFSDFHKNIPYGCKLVGVELDNKAIPIHQYEHPQRAIYLLGAEDNGLTKESMNKCHDLIKLPGEMSMNVSVAGSIVMFDRISKNL